MRWAGSRWRWCSRGSCAACGGGSSTVRAGTLAPARPSRPWRSSGPRSRAAWRGRAAARLDVAGYNLLNWHVVAGGLLGAVVLGHAVVRAKPLRARDLRSRRQLLTAAAVGRRRVRALARPAAAAARARAAAGRAPLHGVLRRGRRLPRHLVGGRPPAARSTARPTGCAVEGRVRTPLALTAADLDAGDELTATLDCTGGFYATRRWRGTSLGRVLDARRRRAGRRATCASCRTPAFAGASRSTDARALLLATRVGDGALSHGHGAPCRLVAPGRRGFQWVKWVTRIEVHEDPGSRRDSLDGVEQLHPRGARS